MRIACDYATKRISACGVRVSMFLPRLKVVVERGIREREKRATRRLFGYRAKIESWTSGSEIGKSQSVQPELDGTASWGAVLLLFRGLIGARFTFERKHCENAFVHAVQGGLRRRRFIRPEPAM